MSNQVTHRAVEHTISLPVSMKKLKGAGIIKVAAAHNLRESASEIGTSAHIDPDRSRSNVVLRGPATSASVAKEARALMAAAGLHKVRKDAVYGIEVLFTLPADLHVCASDYFEAATVWAETHFDVPVLSSVIHLDESVPHCHVLLLPLVAGKMNGGRVFGGRSRLHAVHDSFGQQVLSRFGLATPCRRPRPLLAVRRQAISAARAKLVAHSALDENLIDELLRPHMHDPEPLLVRMNIEMPAFAQARARSFVGIMTRPVPQERKMPTIDAGARSIYGNKRGPALIKVYPCVDFARNPVQQRAM